MAQQTSVAEMLDLAVAKMRPIRRAVMQRRLQNADYRKSVENELVLKLWADEDFCALAPAFNVAKGDDAFTAASLFTFDPANLEKLLEIIMKYLPQILELLLKFLPLFFPLLLACMLTSPAIGQNYPSVGASGLGSTGSKVGMASTGSQVAGLGSTGASTVSKAGGSTGSLGLGSSGSKLASGGSTGAPKLSGGSTGAPKLGSSGSRFRPLRSILENKPARAVLAGSTAIALNTAGVVRDATSAAYQIALVSASQRAATRRKGHFMSIEGGHTVGVGYSSFDPNPNTCFGRGGPGYAVVRGSDGWYATKVVR